MPVPPTPPNPSNSREPSPVRRRDLKHNFERRRTAERALIYEIQNAARSIAAARDTDGQLIYRTDSVFQVLDAVARAPYCMAIADLGRFLGIRKQTAQQFAHAAARAGVIDLEPNPDDKRILQLLLTPSGRSELSAAQHAEASWLMLLLHGLGDRELDATTHVVTVVRQRLDQAAREWRGRKRTIT